MFGAFLLGNYIVDLWFCIDELKFCALQQEENEISVGVDDEGERAGNDSCGTCGR